MVLMNAGKNARHAASITNLQTCGGPKKGGLASSIGVLSANLTAYSNATQTQFALKCVGNYTNPSQVTARAVRVGLH